ncbi:recombination regulator RecX [Tepidicella baoligensis]|uniref:recombination regulator RecX n=1 Tax=Tepidicella baoligensis TaxID=2707016 RepID=UPI0015DBB211|nr:recombination regulator RecX [Tepidicella baoligensis]
MTQRVLQPLSLKGRALRLLAQREHSRQELERKLRSHAAGPQELEALLDALEAEGWLSDERFAEALGRQRAARYGLRRVRADLRAKGVDETLIRATLASLEGSEADRARQAWTRKFGQPPRSAAERARQIRHLLAKGFAPDLVARVVPRAEVPVDEGNEDPLSEAHEPE